MFSPLFRKRALLSGSVCGIETRIWDFMGFTKEKYLTTRIVQELSLPHTRQHEKE